MPDSSARRLTAISSGEAAQVIDVLESQKRKQTGNAEAKTLTIGAVNSLT